MLSMLVYKMGNKAVKNETMVAFFSSDNMSYEVIFNFLLAMLIPPSQPVIEKLSDTSVKVSWSVADGGLPITFFKVSTVSQIILLA